MTTAILERHKRVRAWAVMALVLAGACLFFLGAQPVAVGLFSSPWDKLAHLVTFVLIGCAAGIASGTQGWRRVLFCVVGAVALGALDEWHQAYLPGRVAAWDDLAADALGGAISAVLLRIKYAASGRDATHH